MAVLVTGGAGYIGSHVLLELIAAGEGVVVLDDLSTGFIENIPAAAPFIKGSVGDAALLDEIMSRGEIDAVIHLAASLIVPESVAAPEKYWRNNTANGRVLFDACARHRVRDIVFSSTAAVYGDVPSSAGRVSEDFVPNPVSPYGRSKLASEWTLNDIAAAHGLRHVILRYFNVAGADPEMRAGPRARDATHLIKVACEAALGRRAALQIFGTDYATADGTGVRDYIHVSDLARAHVAALRGMRSGALVREIFNCGYGRGYSVLEVIEAVARASGRPVPAERAPRRAGDIGEIVADNTAILSRTDWRPERADLDAIVRDALVWEEALSSAPPRRAGDRS
ncbi:MAG: UDP-glucose 4-epimerase GalE [Alphaproteobacteria bacterium]|nr:UDP-glucose 4-epimerase GalE [Alphaproteobacteria bacterium]